MRLLRRKGTLSTGGAGLPRGCTRGRAPAAGLACARCCQARAPRGPFVFPRSLRGWSGGAAVLEPQDPFPDSVTVERERLPPVPPLLVRDQPGLRPVPLERLHGQLG